MLLGTIASKPLISDLKLLGAITKGHERENPKQQTNGIFADILDSADLKKN